MFDYLFIYEFKWEGDVVVILVFYFLCFFIFICVFMVKFDVYVNNLVFLCFYLLIF